MAEVNVNDPNLPERPCAGSDRGGHAGGYVFTELDDPDYLAILAWIEAGEYR